ncbi:hypothetical protein SCHPADRAFT_859799 [Schizopora paradoxa]|uniref:BTB domain-containing protein n=1 Tax=Schizopora paradoxa TaxID=27342 RepID=A0A0H2R7A7_9AGAM|nr:hypothetical protein SCHPADRAFT_859799 [Schizopora paradoxa]
MPAPPSKRARTSSITVEQVNAEMATPPTRKLKQHETLWFEDGNIVLATDVHLYSVHRGVLAKNSTVFKDMLDLPNVGGTLDAEAEGVGNGDSWEGKPLVRMVGDSDEDISNILMALYDVKFYSAHKPTTLPILLSLIRMSTKYNFSDIRDEVTRHLQRCYPSDLSSMERRNFDDLFVDHENEAEDYDFQLLAVAQQCNMKTILPMLYFDCAASDLDLILEASESLNIPKDCFKRILRGHVMLTEYAHHKRDPSFRYPPEMHRDMLDSQISSPCEIRG